VATKFTVVENAARIDTRVARDGGVDDLQGRRGPHAVVQDAAARAGRVAGHDAIADGQRGVFVVNAAATARRVAAGNVPVGDGEASDGNGRERSDVKHTVGAAGFDGETRGAGAEDAHIGGDI